MKVRGKTIWARNPAYVIRDAEMVLMFRDGKTLQEIGDKFNISRERVRQRLTSLGLTRVDGGASLRSFIKTSKKVAEKRSSMAARSARHFQKWGMSEDEMRGIDEMYGVPHRDPRHPCAKYIQQRTNARVRGIAWEITFAQWWKVWQDSGHWNERGRGQGYCMARWADDGPYSIENVYICTIGQNFKDSYLVHPASERIAKARVTRAANGSSQLNSSGVTSAPRG